MRRRALVGAIVLAAVTVVVGTSETAADAATRKPSVFVAPNGNDARSCKRRRAPCRTFNRAYRAARPGQVVQVAGGRYPGQTIRPVRGRRGPRVVFRPAPRARVVLGGLTFAGADFVTVKGMRTAVKRSEPGRGNRHGIFVGPGSRYVTLRGMRAGSVSTWKADHVVVKRGRYGPCHAVAGASNVCGNSTIDVSTNVTIARALFHDFRFDESCFSGGADCHWECMYVNGGRNITVKRSRFRDCAVYDIFVTISGPDAGRIGHRHLRIENNWFDTPWAEAEHMRARSQAVSLAWCENSRRGYANVFIRFNSFQRNTGVELDPVDRGCVFENVRVVGNLLMYPGSCKSGVVYRHNLWSTAWRRGKCHRTDRIGGTRFPYVNRRSGLRFNFHLSQRRSAAHNLVPRSAGCPRDIDGQRRPKQRRCDAGSDERRFRR
jgi:hypothetical protein